MSKHIAIRLHKAAEEMTEAGLNGWPNTCRDAAEAVDELLETAKSVEQLIRNGGVVPVRGVAWARLRAAIKRAEEGLPHLSEVSMSMKLRRDDP
jgi:hypothetical protein